MRTEGGFAARLLRSDLVLLAAALIAAGLGLLIGWLLAGLAAGIASNLVSALRWRALARWL